MIRELTGAAAAMVMTAARTKKTKFFLNCMMRNLGELYTSCREGTFNFRKTRVERLGNRMRDFWPFYTLRIPDYVNGMARKGVWNVNLNRGQDKGLGIIN